MFALGAVAIYIVSLSHVYAETPCCMPEKFEITEDFSVGFNTHGYNGMSSGHMRASVDATRKLIAVFGNFYSNGTESNLHIIQDYGKAQTQYVIDLKTKTCTEGPNPQVWVGTCIPPDSTLVSSTYYGKKSANFLVDVYMVPSPHIQPGVTAYVSVAKDGCVPVGEMATGSIKGFNFMTSVGFSEYSIGIANPSVFDIPDICKKGNKVKSKAAKMHRSVGSIIVPSF